MEQNGKILGIGAVIAAVVIPIVGFFMDTVGFGIDILQVWPQQKHLVKKTDRFSCELREGKDKNDPKVSLGAARARYQNPEIKETRKKSFD